MQQFVVIMVPSMTKNTVECPEINQASFPSGKFTENLKCAQNNELSRLQYLKFKFITPKS